MLRNYLKIALRNLKKNAVYSSINIAGLAAGMACCILITLYVLHELSYDKFHQRAGRIFRVRLDLDLNGVLYREPSIPFPAAEALARDFPEVERAVRFYRNDDFPLIEIGDRKFIEERFFFADAAVFEMFDFPLLKGEAKTAFSEPNSVVLTEDMARKYFGDANPLGQTLRYQKRFDLKVTGVVKNVPNNAHFKFDLLAPLQFQLNLWESWNGPSGRHNQWFWTGAWTYVLLPDEYAAQSLTTKFPAFVTKYFPDRIKGGLTLSLQPLTVFLAFASRQRNRTAIFCTSIFFGDRVLDSLIACINFVNLSTAQSGTHAKEVGAQSDRRSIITSRPNVGRGIIAGLAAMLLAVVIVSCFCRVQSAHRKAIGNRPLGKLDGAAHHPRRGAFGRNVVRFVSGVFPVALQSGEHFQKNVGRERRQ
jgi:putative ABC transport system permease protein